MEVKINQDRSLDTRLFGKTQKKLLTLHASSHHPLSVEEHTAAIMFDADNVSSNTVNKQFSKRMVDELLLNNSYNNRVLQQIKDSTGTRETDRAGRGGRTKSLTLLRASRSRFCLTNVQRKSKGRQNPYRPLFVSSLHMAKK